MIWLIIIILAVVGFFLYWFFHRQKYTRERFAFFAAALFVPLGAQLIFHLTNDQSLLNLVLDASNQFFGTHFEIKPSEWTGKVLAVIAYFVIGLFLFLIYREWPGKLSKEEVERNKYAQTRSVINDIVAGFLDVLQIRKIEIANKEQENSERNCLDITSVDQISWREEVKIYLEFISSQYKINLDTDWHAEYSLFTAKYANSNIIIYCTDNEINELDHKKIEEFFAIDNQSVSRVIMISKNGNIYENKNINNLLFEIRNKSEILCKIVDFTDYRTYIHDQFYIKPIANSTLTFAQTYTPLLGKIDNEIIDIENYVDEWIQNNNSVQQIAILGEYGQGKSVLSLKIANQIFENEGKYRRVPIIIELRGKSPRTLDPIDIISTWAHNFDLKSKAILKLAQEGRLLLIFDGFDEMDFVGDKYMRLEHFKNMWKFAYPNSKIIITGRPNFFFDTSELALALNTEKNIINKPYTQPIYLELLNSDQIRDSLRGDASEASLGILNLLNDVNTNKNFIDLISRPSTLFLVRLIWENIKDFQNLTASKIISEFINYVYLRQENKNIDVHILTTNEKAFFMYGIAISMARLNGYSNQISKEELILTIHALYTNLNQNINQDGKMALKERFKDAKYDIQTIATDVRTSGLLVQDLSRNDYFKFAHKSYFEFLIADFFVKYLQKKTIEDQVIVNIILSSLKIKMEDFIFSEATKSFIAEELIQTEEINISEEQLAKNLFLRLYPYKFIAKLNKLFRCRVAVLSISIFLLFSASTVLQHLLKGPYKEISFLVIILTLIVIIELFSNRIRKAQDFIELWIDTCQLVGIDEKIILQYVNKASYENYNLNNEYKHPVLIKIHKLIEKIVHLF